EMDSLRILLYSLIFLLSVFGNLLIIVVLVVNNDLMMAVFCMPFTLIPNLLEDFIFGAAMCKIVAYLMGISVCISTFSLVAIAIERYSAICDPLKSRAWQTRSHAYKVIASTWVLSFLIMTPYPIFSTLVKFTKPNNITAHMCRHDWPKSEVEQAWCILLLFVLFFIPGVVMIIAYGLISRELYRGIQFEMEQKKGQSDNICWIALIMSHLELHCSTLNHILLILYMSPFPLGCSDQAFKRFSAESPLYPLRCFPLNYSRMSKYKLLWGLMKVIV
uniref:Gastrin/cholecystokinin type B receptor n=1 Tax=Sinocyclocheilus grahami TaxID=75366 RepID=A0A672K3C7_SINGR